MWCTNRLLWHTNSDFYGVRTPPFMPYEPFLLGVGVVFNWLTFMHDVKASFIMVSFQWLWWGLPATLQLQPLEPQIISGHLKWHKSDSGGSTPKWPKSGSKVTKVTQKWLKNSWKVTFESLLGHFGVDPPESLLCHFRCLEIIWGSKKSQSQKNRCVFKSQSTKSQVLPQKSQKNRQNKSQNKSQKNR